MYVHRFPGKVQTSSSGDGTSCDPTPPRSRPHSQAPCVRSCRASRELWQTSRRRVFLLCWSPRRSRCWSYRHREPTKGGRLRRGPWLRFELKQVHPWRTSIALRFRCDQPPTRHPWSPRNLHHARQMFNSALFGGKHRTEMVCDGPIGLPKQALCPSRGSAGGG